MKFSELELDIGSWLIFGSAFVLLVWVILKILGVFNTPPLLQNVPYLTGIISVVGIGIKLSKLFLELGKLFHRIDIIESDVGDIKGDVRKLERDMSYVKGKLRISG